MCVRWSKIFVHSKHLVPILIFQEKFSSFDDDTARALILFWYVFYIIIIIILEECNFTSYEQISLRSVAFTLCAMVSANSTQQ